MLSFRLMYGINKENANRNLYIPSDIYFMDMYKSRGHLGYVERRNQTMEGTLSFKKQFGDLLRVDAVVGMGRYTNDSNGLELDYEQINDHIAADKVEASTRLLSEQPTNVVLNLPGQVWMCSTDMWLPLLFVAMERISFSRERNMPISLQYHWLGNYLTSRL